jgi:hypothetical protein
MRSLPSPESDSVGDHMDKEELVELLNADLELEFRSIVQYTQHLAMAKEGQSSKPSPKCSGLTYAKSSSTRSCSQARSVSSAVYRQLLSLTCPTKQTHTGHFPSTSNSKSVSSARIRSDPAQTPPFLRRALALCRPRPQSLERSLTNGWQAELGILARRRRGLAGMRARPRVGR